MLSIESAVQREPKCSNCKKKYWKRKFFRSAKCFGEFVPRTKARSQNGRIHFLGSFRFCSPPSRLPSFHLPQLHRQDTDEMYSVPSLPAYPSRNVRFSEFYRFYQSNQTANLPWQTLSRLSWTKLPSVRHYISRHTAWSFHIGNRFKDAAVQHCRRCERSLLQRMQFDDDKSLWQMQSTILRAMFHGYSSGGQGSQNPQNIFAESSECWRQLSRSQYATNRILLPSVRSNVLPRVYERSFNARQHNNRIAREYQLDGRCFAPSAFIAPPIEAISYECFVSFTEWRLGQSTGTSGEISAGYWGAKQESARGKLSLIVWIKGTEQTLERLN